MKRLGQLGFLQRLPTLRGIRLRRLSLGFGGGRVRDEGNAKTKYPSGGEQHPLLALKRYCLPPEMLLHQFSKQALKWITTDLS